MTIKDIARESGYAVGTVSRVLNNHPGVSAEAREKVMEIVEKYHFQLNSNAKHLKQQASNGISITLMRMRTSWSRPFWSAGNAGRWEFFFWEAVRNI